MKLNFRKLGSGKPLFILHGVFGSSDNWQTLARDFAEKFTVYLIDQRNHGSSPHSAEMNYQVMSDDLAELMADEQLTSLYLMGHSMGGKTAMYFASQHPEKVEKLIVMDIAPKYYPPHHQQIFAGFRSINLQTLQSRKEADDKLGEIIKEAGVRQFVLKNLARSKDGGFEWKVNLDAIEKNIEIIGGGLPDTARFDGETVFIGGTDSHYITDEDALIISRHFPQASIQMISGAGHWVHADKPRELSEMVMHFLS